MFSFLLLSVPPVSIVPLETPTIPTVQPQEWSGTDLWWVPNTNSEWTVVEDCWEHPSLDPRWSALEHSVRTGLQSVSQTGLASGDLNWYADGFCIRTQGLSLAVLDLRTQYAQVLLGLQRSDLLSSATSTEGLSTLDVRHHVWLTPPSLSSTWNWRLWQNFWTGAHHRLIVYSEDEPTLATYEVAVPHGSTVRWIPRARANKSLTGTCLLNVRPEYSQAAVTFMVRYPELSSAQSRAINMLLGTGVRSRLGEYVREELGLVYSIGSQYTGRSIQISYSVDPTGLNDSLEAVQVVLAQLTKSGISHEEVDRLRSMFLLRQYQILEDPASLIRMLGRFDSSSGWEQYIDESLRGIASLSTLNLDAPIVEIRITGGVDPEDLAIPCSVTR